MDYNGQIVIWDIEEGVVLNVFYERGFHINFPNTEMPILDAKWDNSSGHMFVVSTYFGSFSIYGYGDSSFYRMTPVEQFFERDDEATSINPHTLEPNFIDPSGEIPVYPYYRGDICNYARETHAGMKFKN